MNNNPWKIVDDEVDSYNKSQFENEYESTKFTKESLRDILHANKKYNILDVGCSAGANLYHIAKEYRNHSFVGIDINEYFLNKAVIAHNKLGLENTRFELDDLQRSHSKI